MKKIIIGIYKITSPSGSIYIGQSKDIYERWEWYKKVICEGQPRLYRSFIKYGVENHKFEIVEECIVAQLDKKEIYYIKFYNCFNTPHGLNLTNGGDGCAEWSDESKQKVGNANSKRIITQHQKDTVSSANKKIWENLSQQEKDKRLSGVKNYVKTEEDKKKSKEGIIQWHKNNKRKPITEESRKRYSEAGKKTWAENKHKYPSRKGIKKPESSKKNYSEAMKKKRKENPDKYKWTEEGKKKQSERMSGERNPMYGKKRFPTKETKNKISEYMSSEKNPIFGVRHTEERKNKNSISNKVAWERIRQEKLTMIF